MTSVDWSAIMSAERYTIEKESDTYFDIIMSVNLAEVFNVQKLRRLFMVSRILLAVKDNQLDEAIKMTVQDAKDEVQREYQEMRHRQLHKAEPSCLTGEETVALIGDPDYKVDCQISRLNKENLQLERELKLQREIAEKYSKEIVQLSRTKEAIRQEKNMMRVEISDYKAQVHLQWEHFLKKMSEDLKECRENLLHKDKMLNVSMAEIENLQCLLEREEKLKQHRLNERNEMKNKLESINDCNFKLEQMLHEEELANKDLRLNVSDLQEQISNMKKKEKIRSANDKAIMSAIEGKVEEWKNLIECSKREIDHYKAHLQIMKQKLINYEENFKPTSLMTLSKVIVEKDKLIEKLKNANQRNVVLSQGKELISKTVQIQPKDFDRENPPKICKEIWSAWKQELMDVEKSRKEAEKHALEKDKQLYEAQKLIRKFEEHYGVTEARREIEHLQKKLELNERKFENLIQIMNKTDHITDCKSFCDSNYSLI